MLHGSIPPPGFSVQDRPPPIITPMMITDVSIAAVSTMTLTGRTLDRLCLKATPSERALLAANLMADRVQLVRLTARQASRLTGANIRYLAVARHLSDDQRERIIKGKLSLSAIVNAPRIPSDAELDKLFALVGGERMLAALDRFTAPKFVFAAE
jgi:hypothetical protein